MTVHCSKCGIAGPYEETKRVDGQIWCLHCIWAAFIAMRSEVRRLRERVHSVKLAKQQCPKCERRITPGYRFKAHLAKHTRIENGAVPKRALTEAHS